MFNQQPTLLPLGQDSSVGCMYPNGGVSGYFSPLPPLAFWTRKFSLVRGCPAMIGCSAGPLLPITKCQQCPAPVTTTYTSLHMAGCPRGEKQGSVGTRRVSLQKEEPRLGSNGIQNRNTSRNPPPGMVVGFWAWNENRSRTSKSFHEGKLPSKGAKNPKLVTASSYNNNGHRGQR